MKKLLLIIIFLYSSLFSENLNLKQGWNLVGFSQTIDIKELLNNKSITKVLFYKKGEWFNSGLIPISHGAWIFSTEDLNLNLSNDEKSNKNRIDFITLYKGWNLISLPVKTVISPKLFYNQKTIWKYDNGNWYLYKRGNSTKSKYPKIDYIGYGEGFWIYSDNEENITISDKESQMVNFESQKDMLNYLETMVKYNLTSNRPNFLYKNSVDVDGVMVRDNIAVAPTFAEADNTESISKSSISDTTTTNTQEVNVDEADIVKHNGDKIFYLPNNENSIYVTTFDEVLKGNKKPLEVIKTKKRASEFYIFKDKLIVIYPVNTFFRSYWSDPLNSIWQNKSFIEIYNISNLKSIKKIVFSGNIIDSRLTNGNLYIVSRFMPTIKTTYPKIYCEKGEYCWYSDKKGDFKYDYESPIYGEKNIEPLLNGKKFLTPNRLYAPLKINQNSFITTIHSFNLENLSDSKNISFVGNSNTVYSSNRAIYLVSNDYPIFFGWNSYQERSAIYKISLLDMAFKGKIFIDGTILNQFSLSEYQNTLRVASSLQWNWWSGKDTDNLITTIQEDNQTLIKIGEIRGLGKEGETIQGVRFLGDKGYIVTFKKTDPFYIVDLSNPKKPILGANPLYINGYSSYFHSVSKDKILSLGVDADNQGVELGYQIQLFDVADFNSPKLLDKVTIPDNPSAKTRWNYYSEAIYNHKAFVYRDSDKLFGVTIRENYSVPVNREDYIKNNYVKVTDEILERCSKKDNSEKYPNVYYSEVEQNEKTLLALTQDLYTYKRDVEKENCYIYSIYPKSQIYVPKSEYKNRHYLKLYNVSDDKILYRDEVLHQTDKNNYSYQRGIIFTSNNRDYALYFLGGDFTLKELK